MNYCKLFIVSTNTVVGIGAPIGEENKESIYKIKRRSHDKKLVIAFSNFEFLNNIDGWTEEKLIIAKKYWPGEITFIVNKQAYRMPSNKKLMKLLDELGPCYLTSSNISGCDNLTFEESKSKFHNVGNFYDFGTGTGIPSTIVDLDCNKILRQGIIKYIK